MRAIRALSAGVLWVLLAGSAAASPEAEAESNRLQDEILKLAQKNAWTGVERAFQQLDALGLPLTLDANVMGAQAAMEAGDMFTALTRLQLGLRAAESDPDPNSAFQQAKGMQASLQERYGMVHVVIYDENVVPALLRNPMPFSAQERQAITFARGQLVDGRAFMGLLPIGPYQLDQEILEVTPGPAILEVRLGTR